MSLNKTRRFWSFSRSLLSLASLSLFSMPLISYTSFPSLVVSDFRKVSKENQSKIEVIYKQIFGDRGKLLKIFSLSQEKREEVISKIYDVLGESDKNFAKLETFMDFALKDVNQLLLEVEMTDFVNSKAQEKHYIEYISYLLYILTSLWQKFSEKLRGIVSLKTLDSSETKTLFSLIKTGLTILNFTNKMKRLSSIYLKKTLPLPKMSILQLQKNLTNSLDFDLQFIFEKVDQIHDVNAQMPFFEKAVELSIQLLDLVAKDTAFEMQPF